MVEFMENCSELNFESRDRNEARIRCGIETSKCNPQLNNYGWKGIKFFMNNLEWRLYVGINSRKISIQLLCNRQITNTRPIKVKSSLRILNNISGNEIVLEENLPEVTFNKWYDFNYLVENYIVDAQHRTGEWVIMELLLTCHPITPEGDNAAANPQPQPQQQPTASTSHAAAAVQAKNHDAEMLRQELARMQTANDALKKELEYYKEDEDAVHMFIEVLRLFKSKSLKKFRHQMQLGDDVKVHLKMDPIENGDSADREFANAELERTNIEEKKKRIEQLHNENVRLKQENVELKGKMEIRNADIARVEPTITNCTQSQIDLPTMNANQTAGGAETGAQRQFNSEDLHATNEKLQIKVSHLEADLKQLTVFKEAIRLFEMRCCRKFEHEMELAHNVNVQFNMVLKEGDAKQHYNEQKQRELEAEVSELRRQLELAKSDRQAMMAVLKRNDDAHSNDEDAQQQNEQNQ